MTLIIIFTILSNNQFLRTDIKQNAQDIAKGAYIGSATVLKGNNNRENMTQGYKKTLTLLCLGEKIAE